MNIKIVLEYDGTDYAGWQKQPQNIRQKTVQGEVEKILSEILQENINLNVAGRTDAGVHAKYQVANFIMNKKSSKEIDFFRLRYAINRCLYPSVSIKEMTQASDTFHARHSAISRTYRYFITDTFSPFDCRFKTFLLLRKYQTTQLHLKKMNECARIILGENDFTSFCKVGSLSATHKCNVLNASWEQHNHDFIFEITANRFLHSMVRLLVGTMIDVGANIITNNDFKSIIEKKDVQFASALANPHGLFLWDVKYKENNFNT